MEFVDPCWEKFRDASVLSRVVLHADFLIDGIVVKSSSILRWSPHVRRKPRRHPTIPRPIDDHQRDHSHRATGQHPESEHVRSAAGGRY